MTKEEIIIYDYCKRYLENSQSWRDNLPFKVQHFGCGSGQPNIEYSLENIHRRMFEKVSEAITDARSEVQSIIDKL